MQLPITGGIALLRIPTRASPSRMRVPRLIGTCITARTIPCIGLQGSGLLQLVPSTGNPFSETQHASVRSA